MLKFIKRIIVLIFTIIGLCVLLFIQSSYIVNKKYKDSFMAIIKEKYKAINNHSHKSRIVLMVGSNSVFSIDSEKIQKELGIKVINSGLVYNVGYKFQMNFLKNYVQSGDIVVYLPEFGNYSGKGELGTAFLHRCFLYEPQLILIAGTSNAYKFFTTGIKTILEPIYMYVTNKSSYGIGTINEFNIYGDHISHLNKRSQLDKVRSYSKLTGVKISNNFIGDLDNLNSVLTSKNARLLVSFPVYSKNFVSEELINDLDSLSFRSTLFGGNFQNNLLEDNMFYDSPYHALNEARDVYTENLIKIIKDAF